MIIALSITAMHSQTNFKIGTDLTEQFKMGSGTYGTACGIASQAPKMRLQVEDMIQEKNISGLADWLGGSNVHKAYAAEGFIRLANNGVEFDSEIIFEVIQVKNSTEIISACRGCIYDKITLSEALESYEFK